MRRPPSPFFQWWITLPRWLRAITSQWVIIGVIATLQAHWVQDPYLIGFCMVYWICLLMLQGIERFHLKALIARYPWLMAVVLGPTLWQYGAPAFANEGSCSGAGIFAPAATFAFTTFQAFSIGSGGSSITQVAQYVCAIIAVIFIAVILAFLGGAAYTGVQLSTGTPLPIIVQPLTGFALFIVMAVGIMTIMIGTA